MLEERSADPVPDRGRFAPCHARERRHAEVELPVALGLEVFKDAGEEEIHRALRRLGGKAHQVDGGFVPGVRHHQRREGDDLILQPHDGDGLGGDVGILEGTEGEGLFLRLVLGEPAVRNRPEIGKDGIDRAGRHDGESEAVAKAAVVRLAQVRKAASLHLETGEIDDGELPQLEGAQAHIRAGRKQRR